MTALLWVDEGPLRNCLQAKLEELSSGLETLEASVDAYFSKDLPQFQAWVNHHFADDLLQINLLERKVRVLGQHVEDSVKLSIEMEMDPSDMFAEWTEAQVFEKIFHSDDEEREFEKANSKVEEFIITATAKDPVSNDVRDLYRRIVRCLHPDLRGSSLSELEKNVWIRAQQAYAKNDIFELTRIEKCVRCGHLDEEAVSYSELLRQFGDFQKKYTDLQTELQCLTSERAWNFSQKKTLTNLEREIQSEFKNVIKDLRAREIHFQKTITSWLQNRSCTTSEPKAKTKRKSPKSQISLF